MFCAIPPVSKLDSGHERTVISVNDNADPFGQVIELKSLPDVVAASLPHASKVVKSSTSHSYTNSVMCDASFDGRSRVTENRAVHNGDPGVQFIGTTSPHTHGARHCVYCHRQIVGFNGAKDTDPTVRVCRNTRTNASSVSLSFLEQFREPVLPFARRSASLPTSFQDSVPCANFNNNHGVDSVQPVSNMEPVYANVPVASVGTSAYGVSNSANQRDYEVSSQIDAEDKLSTCNVRTKALSAVVVLLTIITLSTLSALIYFGELNSYFFCARNVWNLLHFACKYFFGLFSST